jgi:NAD(P)-dependent dehydrogenase (short-subunit alcohol dehydrogenase family)
VQPAMRSMLDRTPAGRLGREDDIAAAVEFLLSDDATYITGTDLLVDGGLMATITS